MVSELQNYSTFNKSPRQPRTAPMDRAIINEPSPARPNRQGRATSAQQTLSILEEGSYVDKNGEKHDISTHFQRSLHATMFVSSEESDQWLSEIANCQRCERSTTIEVWNETTVSAARRYSAQFGSSAVLNFASARNPGGGFLGGSLAQEESLACSSGLYPTLLKYESEYYEYNRSRQTKLYSDCMIYSPHVPFFRDDGLCLISPFLADVLTCPAVNRGACSEQDRVVADQCMLTRIRKVLSMFARQGKRHIVLGAYGCGVFQNPSGNIARMFASLLKNGGEFENVFENICFAVYCRGTEIERTLHPFQIALGSAAGT